MIRAICVTCGTRYADAIEFPPRCPICEDVFGYSRGRIVLGGACAAFDVSFERCLRTVASPANDAALSSREAS